MRSRRSATGGVEAASPPPPHAASSIPNTSTLKKKFRPSNDPVACMIILADTSESSPLRFAAEQAVCPDYARLHRAPKLRDKSAGLPGRERICALEPTQI